MGDILGYARVSTGDQDVAGQTKRLAHPEDGAAPPLNRPLGAQLDDMEYFQARAEQELAWAQRASHAAVVAAHYELAERYLERVSRWGDEEPSQGH